MFRRLRDALVREGTLADDGGASAPLRADESHAPQRQRRIRHISQQGSQQSYHSLHHSHRHRGGPAASSLMSAAPSGATATSSGSSGTSSDSPMPIRLKHSGFKRSDDGSVTLSVTLDKDQVECCVCLSSMTGVIYRCRAPPGRVCHNVCADCEWQIRRMKSPNGHTKTPKCPMCKIEGPFVRHKALERQLLEISQACGFSKQGCDKRFFPWDQEAIEEHRDLCLCGPILCPFCDQVLPGGRATFVEHLRRGRELSRMDTLVEERVIGPRGAVELTSRSLDPSSAAAESTDISTVAAAAAAAVSDPSGGLTSSSSSHIDHHHPPTDSDPSGIGDESKLDDEKSGGAEDEDADMAVADGSERGSIPGCRFRFSEGFLNQDSQKNLVFTLTRKNTFVVNDKYGFVLVCFAPTRFEPVWQLCAVSISAYHTECGNNRVYVAYSNAKEQQRYTKAEQDLGLLGESLLRPMQGTLQLNMARLTPEFFKDQVLDSKRLLRQKRHRERQRQAERRAAAVTSAAASAAAAATVSAADSSSCIGSSAMMTIVGGSSSTGTILGGDAVMFGTEPSTDGSAKKKRRIASSAAEITMDDGGEDITMLTSMLPSDHHHHPHPITSMVDSVATSAVSVVEDGPLDVAAVSASELDFYDEIRSESCTPSSSEDSLYTSYASSDGCHPFVAQVAGAPQYGSIYAGIRGTSVYHRGLHVRVYTLEESMKVGAILDARDFAGKWYQAEVLRVADAAGHESDVLEETDPLSIRRIKIHYLGYSANYDEWLNVDTDSHRMAQRGTYTVGPDLRAVRRHAHQSSQQPYPRMIVRSREIADLMAAAAQAHSAAESAAAAASAAPSSSSVFQ